MRLVRDSMRTESRLIESYQPPARGLEEIWDEFLPDWMHEVENFSESYVNDALDAIEAVWSSGGNNNPEQQNVLETVRRLRLQIPNMRFPNL